MARRCAHRLSPSAACSAGASRASAQGGEGWLRCGRARALRKTSLRRSSRGRFGHGTDYRGLRLQERTMPSLPPIIAWTLGAIGAFVVMKLISREWQRVNNELDEARPVRVTDPERARLPTLRRDPVTGEYRPHR